MKCDEPAKPAVRLCQITAAVHGTWKQEEVWCFRSRCPFLQRKDLLHSHHSNVPRETVRARGLYMCVHGGEQMLIKKKSERGLEKSSVICFNDLLILLYWYSRGCCCQWHLHLWTYGIYDHEIRTFIHPLKLLVDSVPLLPAWNRRILLSESICKTLLLFSSKYKYTRANCQG